jgi:hypothetical protein
MNPITNPTEAVTALRNYEKSIPDTAPEALIKTLADAANSLSPVDAAVKAAEALYHFRTEIDLGGQELAYSLISWCNMMGFHRLGGTRGLDMVKALMREMEIQPPAGVEWPEPESDPESDQSYLSS